MGEDFVEIPYDEIADALSFDPLDTAEKLMGYDGSYKERSMLGLLLALESGKRKNSLLTRSDDTTLTNKLNRYQRIIEDLGFELVFVEPFASIRDSRYIDDDFVPMISDYNELTGEITLCRNEKFFIYAHRDGILLCFDTYEETRVNSGNFYYNYHQTWESRRKHHVTSSSSPTENPDILAGSHDCREAIRYRINQLRKHGKFITPWIQQPFLWLLHHGDAERKTEDYKAVNQRRIAQLPDWVRNFMDYWAQFRQK